MREQAFDPLTDADLDVHGTSYIGLLRNETMPRRKPGLHKNLSDILDGARIPEEARGQSRLGDSEDQPTSPARVQQDVG